MATANETPLADQPEPLMIARTFAVPRKLVFRAWSSAEHVKQWFCPSGYSVPQAKVEFRVGGVFEVCMRSPQGQEHWTRGSFTEIVPETRLVIDMMVPGPDARTLFRATTIVNFADIAGATRMDVTQRYTLYDPQATPMVQGAPQGWAQTLDRLAQALVGMPVA